MRDLIYPQKFGKLGEFWKDEINQAVFSAAIY